MKYVIALAVLAISVVCLANTTQEKAPVTKTDAAIAASKARVAIVKYDIEISKIDLDTLTTHYERAKRLHKQQSLANEELENMTQKYLISVVNHNRNKARLQEAEALLRLTELTGETDRALTFQR